VSCEARGEGEGLPMVRSRNWGSTEVRGALTTAHRFTRQRSLESVVKDSSGSLTGGRMCLVQWRRRQAPADTAKRTNETTATAQRLSNGRRAGPPVETDTNSNQPQVKREREHTQQQCVAAVVV